MFGRRRNDPQPPRDPIHDAIERRAFELFLARGARHGYDLDDWFRAEREFLGTATTGDVGVDHEELVAAGFSTRTARS